MSQAAYEILLKQQEGHRPHDPLLPPIIENEKDGSIMVLVHGGEFLMGSDPNKDKDVFDRDQPQHVHYLPDYYIGIYPVTNRQCGVFIQDTGHRVPEKADWGTPVWNGGKCPEDRLDHPLVCVSWEDAEAYCEWAGLMLPTEAMWEKAARGRDGRIYPWGDGWDESRCRNGKNRGSEETCEVWGYPGGIGPNGIYQASGNVWEWCNDCYEEEIYKRYSRGNFSKAGKGTVDVLRGGSWCNSSSRLFRCSTRIHEFCADSFSLVGFRPSRLVF